MTAFGEQGDLFDAIDNRSLWESFREGEFDLSRQVFIVVAFQADGLDIIPGKAELDAAADIVELEYRIAVKEASSSLNSRHTSMNHPMDISPRCWLRRDQRR